MKILYAIYRNNSLLLIFDAVVIVASWVIASLIISKGRNDLNQLSGPYPVLFIFLFSYLAAFYLFQLYRIIWQYAHSRDFRRIFYASLTGMVAFTVSVSIAGYIVFPEQVVLSGILVCLLVLFSRLVLKEGRWIKESHVSSQRKIIIAGAGEAGRLILSEFYRRKLGSVVFAFVDDDPRKIGTIVNGKKVFGPAETINTVCKSNQISEIIIAMPSVASEKINTIFTQVRSYDPDIIIKTLPPITRLFDNLPLIPDLMEISISGMLERDEYTLNLSSIEQTFAGKTILITGAGGSIGSELCKQILKFGIKRLVALGRGEHSMYLLIKSLNEYIDFFEKKPQVVYKIADVRDRDMIDNIFQQEKPDIVIHAAAHKHVPLMEFNEAEALINNVCGTDNVLYSALKNGSERFILVSTDKAVNPVNIMGASKRIAELVTGSYEKQGGLKTAVVRFGNVLGSRGSVVPLFIEQIKKGGPVTITHADITRYFMSIPEASLLVINAASLCRGGETFVLDMGKPYRLLDLAKKLISMYGLEPEKDIAIEYTGLRPGEKLHEDLFYSSDELKTTDNNKIFIHEGENPCTDKDKLEHFISQCRGDESSGQVPIIKLNAFGLRKRITEIIPEFRFDDSHTDIDANKRLIN